MTHKFLLLPILFFLYFNISIAQKKQYSLIEKATYYTQQMTDSLLLDTLQQHKVYDINLYVSTSIDSIYKLHLEDKERKTAMKAIFETRNNAYKKILTAPQFLKFDDMEREKRMKKRKRKN